MRNIEHVESVIKNKNKKKLNIYTNNNNKNENNFEFLALIQSTKQCK